MHVGIVRPRPGADRTAERLASVGHEALVAPLFTTVPTRDPMPPGTFDAAIVTSFNAVPALARRAGALGGVPVFALGERTAAALREAGFSRVRAGGGDAAGLAALVAAVLPVGAAILHPAGRHRKAEPEASLGSIGFRVVTWNVYEAEAARRLPDPLAAALRDGLLGAILHYSRRGAETLCRLTDEAGLSAELARPAHLCLSADVASGLAGRAGRVIVADRPDEDALMAKLGRP